MTKYEADLSQIYYVVLPLVRRAGQMLGVKQVAVIEAVGKDKETLLRQTTEDVFKFESETVRMLFPEHAVLGTDSSGEKSEWQWIFTPLDGELYYKNGLPLFTTSAVLRHKGEVVLAIVHQPQTDDTYHTLAKQGAFHNERQVSLGKTKDLKGSLAYVASREGDRDNQERSFAITKLTKVGATVLSLGVPSLGLCYMAAGLYDSCYLALDSKSLVKQVAGLTIAREAGAVVTDSKGKALSGQAIDGVIVANKLLHKQVVDTLKK
jgi:myo-inositol-1(or 4)-monophosphatase